MLLSTKIVSLALAVTCEITSGYGLRSEAVFALPILKSGYEYPFDLSVVPLESTAARLQAFVSVVRDENSHQVILKLKRNSFSDSSLSLNCAL